MTKRENAPCYGCQKHTIDCHGKCPDYNVWSKEQKEKKMAAFKAKEPQRVMNEYLVDKIIKSKKRNRK